MIAELIVFDYPESFERFAEADAIGDDAAVVLVDFVDGALDVPPDLLGAPECDRR